MSQPSRVRTSPAHQHLGDSLAAPAMVGQGVCTSRTHIDAHGSPVFAGCMVSVLGARPVKVQRLHGEGQFVFLRAGVEVTQFCCTARVIPASITGQSGAAMVRDNMGRNRNAWLQIAAALDQHPHRELSAHARAVAAIGVAPVAVAASALDAGAPADGKRSAAAGEAA